jgi:hypothetical protein
MRTPTVLCLLLSLGFSGAQAQVAGSTSGWRVDPAMQRERDAARKSILEDELASEARQFTDARAEMREAQARRVPVAKTEEIAVRLDRHRRNMVELGREIARVEGDIGNTGAAKRAAGRTPDNWLVPGHAAAPADVDSAPSASAQQRRPEWVIPGRTFGKLP